jgi:hypothetical protein
MAAHPRRVAPHRVRGTAARDWKATLTKAKRLVRRYPGVIGVDWGHIYEDGVRTGEQGVRFHVPRKLPLRALAMEDRLPKAVDKTRADVIEGGYKPHGGDPFALAATLQPGLSIGNVPRESSGTLGLFVRDRGDGALCILSNWHVLCGGLAARKGDMISQPGPQFLGPNPPRQVAELRRWVTPARQYDAAIAALASGMQISEALLTGNVTIARITDPQVGMHVVKSGAASGFTHALIDGINGSYQVPYDEFGDTIRWMVGIHLVPDHAFHDRDVSLEGDSGSAWIDANSGNAVALNFAGENDAGPLNEYALAHPIADLFHLLDLDLTG